MIWECIRIKIIAFWYIANKDNFVGYRIVREGKERRRLWAQRITPRPTQEVESVQDVTESETHNESMSSGGMLPNDIVELLTAREKYALSLIGFII